MGELLERYKYMNEMANEVQKKKEEQEKKDKAAKEKDEKYVENLKEARDEQIRNYNKFRIDLKDMLLSEAIYHVYAPCLGELSESTKVLSENLVNDYIKENGGADMVILKSRGKTLALETVFNCVEDTYSSLLEKADKKDPKVNKCDMQEFFDSLDGEEDIENMSQAIRLRVANAEEEFLNNNISDKMAMKDIADDTASRISAAKADDGIDRTTADDIEQEATMLSKRAMENIRHNRPRSVFEQMVRKLSDSVMKDNSLLESYSTDNHIDIAKVVESARCMYGMLETVNSMQLEKVDEKYISDMFK